MDEAALREGCKVVITSILSLNDIYEGKALSRKHWKQDPTP
jgi:hypothetical protein